MELVFWVQAVSQMSMNRSRRESWGAESMVGFFGVRTMGNITSDKRDLLMEEMVLWMPRNEN